MHLSSRLTLTAVLLSASLGATQLKAQFEPQPQTALCRAGILHPFVGAYTEQLNITGLGTESSLISINQGGTLTETDGVDLENPERVVSPGYGAWQTQDCQHYIVNIRKIIYDMTLKAFQTTTLTGNATLSLDGNSWTANLNQQFFDANGNVIRTDTVTATATRIQAVVTTETK